MQIENAVYPTSDSLTALAALPHKGPIVMLNLLKFRDKAVYKDGRATDLSGLERLASSCERRIEPHDRP